MSVHVSDIYMSNGRKKKIFFRNEIEGNRFIKRLQNLNSEGNIPNHVFVDDDKGRCLIKLDAIIEVSNPIPTEKGKDLYDKSPNIVKGMLN